MQKCTPFLYVHDTHTLCALCTTHTKNTQQKKLCKMFLSTQGGSAYIKIHISALLTLRNQFK